MIPSSVFRLMSSTTREEPCSPLTKPACHASPLLRQFLSRKTSVVLGATFRVRLGSSMAAASFSASAACSATRWERNTPGSRGRQGRE